MRSFIIEKHMKWHVSSGTIPDRLPVKLYQTLLHAHSLGIGRIWFFVVRWTKDFSSSMTLPCMHSSVLYYVTFCLWQLKTWQLTSITVTNGVVRRNQQDGSHRLFVKLVLEVTSQHFYCILFVRRETLETANI